MQRKQNSTASSSLPGAKPSPHDLPIDRAFVLHLDAGAQPPYRIGGRVEHVTSGQVAHFASVHELKTFLAMVLRHLREAE